MRTLVGALSLEGEIDDRGRLNIFDGSNAGGDSRFESTGYSGPTDSGFSDQVDDGTGYRPHEDQTRRPFDANTRFGVQGPIPGIRPGGYTPTVRHPAWGPRPYNARSRVGMSYRPRAYHDNSAFHQRREALNARFRDPGWNPGPVNRGHGPRASSTPRGGAYRQSFPRLH